MCLTDNIYPIFVMVIHVLLDFSLTVKAATFIFISGRGSANSSAKQGKSGSIYNLVKIFLSYLGRANVRAFHENSNRLKPHRQTV